MTTQKTIFIALLTITLASPSVAKESCRQRLEAAEILIGHPTWVAMQISYHQENGSGTQQELDALKQRWLDGKTRGYAQLETIIEDCDRQAKQTKNPAEAAYLLATVFNAKHAALRGATPGHKWSHIYADAVAAISAVDRHDETDAVIPFLIGASMYTWDEDKPEEAIHLMQRAIDLAERHYGRESTERADILTKFAFLFSPVEVSPGHRSPHADAERSEELHAEALAIYDLHPEAMATEEYLGLVGQARSLYELIGNEEQANVLDARYLELARAEVAARKNGKN